MNPVNSHVYIVDGCVYRRNIPVERIYDHEQKQGNVKDFDSDGSDVDEGNVNVDAYEYEERQEDHEVDESGRISYDSDKKSWMGKAYVPDLLMGRFIGTKAMNKKKMEESTRCNIQIPQKGSSSPVVIYSTVGKSCVESCLDQIELFLCTQRERSGPSHFVSLPLNVEPIMSNYEKFKEEVSTVAIIDPNIWVLRGKLHLTLSIMTLFDDNEVEKIGKRIDELVETKIRALLKNKPMKVSIKGLGHFGDEDGTETRVLFAKPSGDKLNEVRKLVYDALREMDLGKKIKNDGTVLHMTLAKVWSKEQVFDTSEVLAKFANFDFGCVDVAELRICLMHQLDSNSGTYQISYVSLLS
ncbi:unnamed protein product [Bursaphelenchus okinawaensis]|uniref:K Homology domain-containing protein n=1 Tax=Bursaphelenchus okinawaensis TaxID=465554 RepID=A0A811K2K5_9BILA|nr:unnamed protein product [Bursaphelenchus okinawaensis]CAG9090596.1 unnamed protein product [Bursaphelenchus okinawaensis]